MIAVGSDAQWVACARALGLASSRAIQPWPTNAGRLAQRERIVACVLEPACRPQPAAQWRRALDAAGVPNGIVRQRARGASGNDRSALTGMPSSVGGRVRFAPPAIDEHGAVIRRRVGCVAGFRADQQLAEGDR